MFVLNPCENDARVLRSARALQSTGREVRIFALANGEFPAEVVTRPDGVVIHRLPAQSLFTQFANRARKPNQPSQPAAKASSTSTEAASAPTSTEAASAPTSTTSAETPATTTSAETPATTTSAQTPAAPSSTTSAETGDIHILVKIRRKALAVGRKIYRKVFTLYRKVFTLYRKVLRLARLAARRMLRRLKLLRSRVRGARVRTASKVRRQVRSGVLKVLRPTHIVTLYTDFARLAGDAAIDWQADIVHAHDMNALLATNRVQRQRPVPLIYDSHELWRHRNAEVGSLRRAWEHRIERKAITNAAGVITVSGSIADWLQTEYDLPVTPTVLRNIPETNMSGKVDLLRSTASLTNDDKIMLYTGRITQGRGIDDCVRALSLLPKDVHLVMLGYGPDADLQLIDELAKAEKVSHRLHHVPPVAPDQVVATAAGGDLAMVAIEPLCLSYEYCLPNKLFESLHAGLPIVATQLTELTRLVEGHNVGFVYEPGDYRSLSAAVVKVLANESDLRSSARNLAQQLTWEKEQLRLIELYDSLEGQFDVD